MEPRFYDERMRIIFRGHKHEDHAMEKEYWVWSICRET